MYSLNSSINILTQWFNIFLTQVFKYIHGCIIVFGLIASSLLPALFRVQPTITEKLTGVLSTWTVCYVRCNFLSRVENNNSVTAVAVDLFERRLERPTAERWNLKTRPSEIPERCAIGGWRSFVFSEARQDAARFFYVGNSDSGRLGSRKMHDGLASLYSVPLYIALFSVREPGNEIRCFRG